MQTPPLALVLLAVVASLAGDLGSTAAADQRRPRRSQPVAPARAAPDVTGTIATPRPAKADPAATPSAEDETLPPLFNLPSAPRARMRACGEKWQGIKMSGQAADATWREFATKCLAERAP